MPAKVGREWQREDETVKTSPEDLPVSIRNTKYLGHDEDPKTVIEGLSANEKLIADRSHQYTISPIDVLADGVIIEGLNYRLEDSAGDPAHGLHIKADDVVIRDCIGDGNKANNTGESYGIHSTTTGGTPSAENPTVVNCIMHDWNDIGVRLDADGSLITKSVSYASNRDGLAIDQGNHTAIVNSRCWGNGDGEIGVGGSGKHCLIGGNVVWADGVEPDKAFIFAGTGVERFVVANNVIDGEELASGDGIKIRESDILNHLISDNLVYRVGGNAIELTDANHYTVIADNNIDVPGGHGIKAVNSVYVHVQNNMVHSPGGNGVLFEVNDGSAYDHGFVITGNMIQNPGSGTSIETRVTDGSFDYYIISLNKSTDAIDDGAAGANAVVTNNAIGGS